MSKKNTLNLSVSQEAYAVPSNSNVSRADGLWGRLELDYLFLYRPKARPWALAP